MDDKQELIVPIPATQRRLGGVSRTTVYELIKAGELEKVNIGRRGFITAGSIERYVERLTNAARGGAA